jgi:F-type H+-transporting ATPase subunit a
MSKHLHKKNRFWRNLLIFGGLLLFAVFQAMSLGGQTEHPQIDAHQRHAGDPVAKEVFKAGDLIIEHIIDAHEWHILTLGDFHLTIPLPVILWHKGELHVFMSSRFHHGHDQYQGFAIAHEGANKGKIVELLTLRLEGDELITTVENEDLPLDFSITKNVLSIFLSLIFMGWLFISIARAYSRRRGEAPKGAQSFLEPLILFIRDDIAKASIGEKKYERYMPFLLTLFFFIFLNNLLGLVPFFPGGANVTGNVAVTGVLALFTFFITTFSAGRSYWVHLVNTPGVPWWLKLPIPLMPIVELIGVFTKPFVLMVRLFANMTAGHIIVLGFISLIFIFGEMGPVAGYGISLVSVAFSVFMYLLELLVAFIQAYVFTLLSALYFGMAIDEGH